jgi:hypothetical protein
MSQTIVAEAIKLNASKRKLSDAPANESDNYIDPVVQVMQKEDRPPKEVVCQRCPGALWFTTLSQLKCFCKEMRVFTWTAYESRPITRCAGQIKALAQLAEEGE